jgi:hypothetical protein
LKPTATLQQLKSCRKQSNQLSNEFADLLARAGLRQPRKHVAGGGLSFE